MPPYGPCADGNAVGAVIGRPAFGTNAICRRQIPAPSPRTDEGDAKTASPVFFVVFKWKCICSVAVNLVGAGAFDGPHTGSDAWHGAS